MESSPKEDEKQEWPIITTYHHLGVEVKVAKAAYAAAGSNKYTAKPKRK